jgi:hypothetical protein
MSQLQCGVRGGHHPVLQRDHVAVHHMTVETVLNHQRACAAQQRARHRVGVSVAADQHHRSASHTLPLTVMIFNNVDSTVQSAMALVDNDFH